MRELSRREFLKGALAGTAAAVRQRLSSTARHKEFGSRGAFPDFQQ